MAAASPPDAPIGFASKAGVVGAVALFLSALAAYQDGRTPEAMTALIGSAVTLVSVLWGRYQQAVAARRSPAPVIVQGGTTGNVGTSWQWEGVPPGATVTPTDPDPEPES